MTRSAPHRSRDGFSLVELLVTIAVIAVILGLLSNGISTVRSTARTTACRTNLRQLHVAAETYHISEESYPAAVLYVIEDGSVLTKAWDFVQSSDGEIRPGPIWSYLDGPDRVFQCPDFEGASTFGADPATGYNYNTTFIGAEGRYPIPGPNGTWKHGWDNCRRGVRVGAHRHPSSTALFGDGGWRDGANKFMRAPSNRVEVDLGLIHGGTQAFRHQGCTNVCCLDGHVEGREIPHEGMHATDAMLEEITDFPRNGFLSDDDSAYDPR